MRPGLLQRIVTLREVRGLRLGPIRYSHDLALAEKRRIWEALEAALRIVAESERR